jgi:hypothetical protein
MKKQIKFSPGDTNYRWDFSENSPFSKRNLTVFSHDRKAKAKSLNVKKKYYALFFSNEKEAYLSRNQNFQPLESHKAEKKYIKENELPGSPLQIQFSIKRLLKKIIQRFETNPQALFEESGKIIVICRDEGYVIPTIQAFNKIENWNEFMQLLYSLYDNEGSFTFELMVAAIVQYAKLCGGK